ncbi:MAG: dipeptide ABC transporter ATP-binding protein [Actinobacteria bacterium]|uniref:Unannotated protein n=1 Tax=freshwater metagenome TaxID=449393 RepID=A0A6J7JH18_9ZZZZ|nr:dipeptide ABC transporter ATP-binding protein [Actinomycetota bacterium]
MTTNIPTRVEAAAIDVEGLTIGFPRSKTPVVFDVSLSVQPGEVLGIVGESGCGKTTLGLGLLAYTRPGLEILGGSVRIGDVDLVGLPVKRLREFRGNAVSYVPQDPASALNPALRIGVQLRETLQAHPGGMTSGEDVSARVNEVLEEVSLPVDRTLRSYPHQLSGGQQQRVAIAMAVVCRPRLIVMDEPTTGLDVSTQRQILRTVRRLNDEYNCAVVYVSHDLPVVAEIADRVLVMYAGRVVEQGPAGHVLIAPSHPYSVGLLKAAPSLDHAQRLVGISGNPPRPGAWPAGCSFADRCSRVTPECRESVPDLVGDREVGVRCLHPIPPTTNAASVGIPAAPPAATPAVAPVLEVTGLRANYGSSAVLHNLAFTIDAGSTLAIVGESGSGKTTLARCLSGLHTDWTGTVSYGQQSLAAAPSNRTVDQRRSIQYVFQNPYGALNPRKSTAEILEAPLLEFRKDLSRSQRRELVAQALSDVSLGTAFLDRYPFQLSGGERQRVAIGRALILEPDLLICDEVTAALDLSVQAAIVEQLRKVQDQRGVSILFITHNLAVVRSIADSCLVLSKGKIVERGTVEKVLNDPQDPYTIGLLRDVPRLGDALQRPSRDNAVRHSYVPPPRPEGPPQDR